MAAGGQVGEVGGGLGDGVGVGGGICGGVGEGEDGERVLWVVKGEPAAELEH